MAASANQNCVLCRHSVRRLWHRADAYRCALVVAQVKHHSRHTLSKFQWILEGKRAVRLHTQSLPHRAVAPQISQVWLQYRRLVLLGDFETRRHTVAARRSWSGELVLHRQSVWTSQQKSIHQKRNRLGRLSPHHQDESNRTPYVHLAQFFAPPVQDCFAPSASYQSRNHWQIQPNHAPADGYKYRIRK
ncbi:Uncharacterised protein [Vibrio cholerae]|nr:Uncharacterised protein [Vibrio cholerae]CSD57360.1 Uncharacterised protein [Vibrio cholerae]